MQPFRLEAVFALATTALLGGCRDSESTKVATTRLTADDVDAPLAVSPEAMGWTWSANPAIRFSSAVGLAQAAAQREIEKAVLRAQAHAGFVRGGMSRSGPQTARGNAVFSVYVNCLRCAAAVADSAEAWAKAIDEAARTAAS